MAYQVISGEVRPGILYYVAGEQSVYYNTITYPPGTYFRGEDIGTFTYSGTGTQLLNEVAELRGAAVELDNTGVENVVFLGNTLFTGSALEYELSDAEKIVNEVTKIQGFAFEVIDYPFYAFEITETRL